MANMRFSSMGVQRQGHLGHLSKDAQRREPDQRAWLSKNDIGQVGEAGVGLPGGRVGQNHDEGHFLVPQSVGGGDGLGHLHQ